MKTIDQDELFHNVTQFLERKGVELKEGTYSKRLRQCCGVLTDVVNATNKTVARACAEVDQKLKDIRETLRGRTGAKPPPRPPAPPAAEPRVAPAAKTEAGPGRKPAAKRVRPEPASVKRAKRKVTRKSKAAGS